MVITTSELTKVNHASFLRVVNTNGENANGNTENVDPDEVSDDSL